MEKISFVKMSGAGNDFIVIDSDSFPNLKNVLSQTVINKLCNRRFGIGADGLILVENSNDSDFQMNYFNADGSEGTLCGNGARCAIRFAEFSGRIKNIKTEFYSGSERFSGEIVDNKNITFYLNEPSNVTTDLLLKIDNENFNVMFADTGSPHVVININSSKEFLSKKYNYNSITDFPVLEFGKLIRDNEKFSPEGTNVNFIQIKNDEILIRTYERGVEDETLACGTGSVASAILSHKIYRLNPPVKLSTAGGEKLIVNFSFSENGYKNLSLTGIAEIIFSGEFFIKNFI